MRNIILILIFTCFACNILEAQTPDPDTYISVNDTVSNEALVKEILINDPCALVDNVFAQTGTDFGESCDGISYFTNKNPDFPIEEGVVLATTDAQDAEGPPGGIGGSICSMNWPDDSQLTEYMHDVLGNDDAFYTASSLEFEFTPVVDSLSFNFVFASDEYGTFQCAYADAFAFFLENADTGEITNLAIVPGTDDPISVVTIRDNQFNGSCSSENEEYFDAFYDDFMAGAQPTVDGPIGFKGNTVLMTAGGAVEPFQKYRMKLVIQNRLDASFNSAVFLEAGSFDIGSTDFLGSNITPDSPEAVCEGEEIELTVSGLVDVIEDASVTWYYEGSEMTENSDKSEITVTEEGTYSVSIVSPEFTECSFDDEIHIEFKETPHLPEEFTGTKVFCEDFEYTLVGTPDNLDELYNLSYEWYKDGVQLSESGSTLDVTEPGEYTIIVSNVDCDASATIEILQPDFEVELEEEFEFCEGSSVELSPEIYGIDPDDADYEWSTGETSAAISVEESGTYTLRVSYEGCVQEVSVEVDVWPLPEVDLGEDIEKCEDEIVELRALLSDSESDDFTYDWYLDGGLIESGNNNSIEVEDAGTYIVEVYADSSPEGCTGYSEVEISYYDNARCIIPEGISPNGDGYNDSFDLTFLHDRTGISSIEIFNRYGMSVYKNTDGYTNDWYGQRDNGDDLVTGTYYYVIKLREEDEVFDTQVLTGWIYVNREI